MKMVKPDPKGHAQIFFHSPSPLPVNHLDNKIFLPYLPFKNITVFIMLHKTFQSESHSNCCNKAQKKYT